MSQPLSAIRKGLLYEHMQASLLLVYISFKLFYSEGSRIVRTIGLGKMVYIIKVMIGTQTITRIRLIHKSMES